jgi:hypothetical protein
MTFEGVYTALVTPFAADGSIDWKALRRLVDFQVDGGVAGLVPVGTTGESPTLDGEECREVIRVVVEQAGGRVPVIAGAGSNCTAEAIHYAKDAKEAGAQATLQVTPYYNKPTADGLTQHFRADRQEHRQRGDARAGETPEDPRGEGGERRPEPGDGPHRRQACRLRGPLGRRQPRLPHHEPWRHGRDFGRQQHRA